MIKIRKELETVMITRIAREGAKIIIEIIIKDWEEVKEEEEIIIITADIIIQITTIIIIKIIEIIMAIITKMTTIKL